MDFDDQLELEHLIFTERKCRICGQVKSLTTDFYVTRKNRTLLSETAFNFYRNNIKNKIAVTGTNGKTSVTFFINYLLKSLKKNSATIGTLGSSIGKKSIENLTTPDPVSLAKEMKLMYSKNID